MRAVGEGREDLPRMLAAETAKRLVRGMGTLVGVAELARPASWTYLSAPAARPAEATGQLARPPSAS
jgi:hypothetical protein